MVSPNVKAVQQKWRVSTSREQKRLLDAASCKLAGSGGSLCNTRTRTTKRPPFASRNNSLCVPLEDEDDTTIASSRPRLLFCSPFSATTPSTISSSVSPKQSRKPDASRVVMETRQISDFIERNTTCPLCESPVSVTFVSKMIASTELTAPIFLVALLT